MGLPPGPRSPAPLQTLRLQRDPLGMLDHWRARYGDCFAVSLLPAGRLVVVAEPQAARRLLTGDRHAFRAGDATRRLLPLLGEGSVLLADGDRHVERRRALAPPFHGARLGGYRAGIEAIAGHALERWPLGTPFPTLPALRSIAFEVVARLALGLGDAAFAAELHRRLLRMFAPPAGLALWLRAPPREPRPASPWRALARRRDAVDALLLEALELRRDGPLRAVADAAGSREELCDELRALLIVGHETTATGIAWAVELLLRHPGALGRVREELRRGEERQLEAAVHETLRLRPPVVDAVRTLAAPAELCGFALPVGTLVMAAPALVQRRADLYPDPEAFCPERFLGGRPDPAAWIPFGGGHRRCLGAGLAMLEMKAVLSVLLSRLELRPARAAPERARLLGTTLVPERGAEVVIMGRARRPREAS